MSDWSGAADESPATTSSGYITIEEGDALALLRPNSAAWTGATSTDKDAAIQEATRRIDSMILRGTKYDTDQALEFPRIIDGQIVGDASGSAVVPDQVKQACLEEAIAILAAGSSGGRQALQAQGVASYQIPGILSETFRAGAGSETLLSQRARQIMRRYMGAAVR